MKPKISDINKNSKARFRVIDNTSKILKQKFRGLQNDLHSILLSRLVNRLQIDDGGNIINNPSNRRIIETTSYIDKFLSNKAAREVIGILNDNFASLDNLAFEKSSFFKNLKDQKSNIQNKTKRILGLKPRAEGEGNWFGQMRNDTSQQRKIKLFLGVALTNELNIKNFRNQLRGLIKGNKSKLGVIENFQELTMQSTSATETYDRLIQDEYANQLQLNYAIYQGSEIDTTREFCSERNGNVYKREEALSWQNLQWKGKKSPHNIIIDCGGHNCRHYWDWISYELAVQLRPNIGRSRFDNA